MLNTTGIVERIEEIRKNNHLSAAGFASRIGVQRSAMSHILSGRNKPSLEFLMKVYDTFEEVTLEWLILGIPNPKKNESHLLGTIEVEDKSQTPPPENPIPKIINNQIQSSIPTEEKVSPKEIIYIYSDGSFERFTPSK